LDRHRDQLEHVGVLRDRDDKAVRAVLSLGEQVERQQLRVRVAVADDHQLARAGDPVDPHHSEHLALGLLDPGPARPGDHVDRLDRLGPVGECGDRLGATGAVDLVDAAERTGGEDRRVDLALGRRRARTDGDLVDPGSASGGGGHHD
jgi:hypothetical protein